MRSWVEGADGSGFGAAHLPYGVVTHEGGHPELAVRIGQHALSLARLQDEGLLDVDDLERLVGLVEDGCLHGSPPRTRAREEPAPGCSCRGNSLRESSGRSG